MNSIKPIVYFGDDLFLFDKLVEQLEPNGYQLETLVDPTGSIEEFMPDWYRLLILDIDVVDPGGLELLRAIKNYHAGVPIIVIAEPENLPIAQLGVACQNGAEALFFKPLTDTKQLLAVVEDAFHRLGCWRANLEICATHRGIE